MKARNIAPLALVIFAGLFVSGCGAAKDLAWGALWDESVLDVLKIKYMPTEWYWWILAVISLWLPMRKPATQKWAIRMALISISLSVIPFIWHILSGLALAGALLVAVIGGPILALLVTLIRIGKKPAAVFQQIDNRLTPLQEQANKSIGKAESELDASKVILAVLGGIGSIVIMGMLFGGILYPEKVQTGWHHYDAFLRGIGFVVSMVSFGFIIHDYKHGKWVCEECDRLIWDLHSNKALCPHCDYPNPKVGWICRNILGKERCGAQNIGKDLYCAECNTPRPRIQKFLDNEEDDDIIDAEFTEHHEPPPRRQLPAPSQTITCRSCGNEISADAKVCGQCGGAPTAQKPADSRKPQEKLKRRNPAAKYR